MPDYRSTRMEPVHLEASLAERPTKQPLRFLTVADVPPDPNSGAAGTVWATNEALRELGHEVDAIWADDLGRRRIRHGNFHSLLEQPRAYRRAVRQAIARRDYDVVLMSQPQAYLAAKWLKQSGFSGIILNRSHGVELRVDRVLPHWHRVLGVPESRFPALTRLLRRRLRRHWNEIPKWCDGVIVPSEEDRRCLLDETPLADAQVRVIHHGTSDMWHRDTTAFPSDDRFRRVLYVGQFSFIKGPHLLSNVVCRILASRHVSVTWVTSCGAVDRVYDLLNGSMPERLRVVEWRSQRELVQLYDSHGVFLFTSLVEGAAKAVLEAMTRGMCVVAAATGAIPDYIEDGASGCLFPVGDVAECERRLIGVLDHPDVASSMGQNAASVVRQFTWRRTASAIARYAVSLSETQAACCSDTG